MTGYPPVFVIGVACALAGAGIIGWKIGPDPQPVAASFQQTGGAVRIPICGSGKRITCVVDGDTIWFQGEKIRIEGFNAPEVQGPVAVKPPLQGRRRRDCTRSCRRSRSRFRAMARIAMAARSRRSATAGATSAES